MPDAIAFDFEAKHCDAVSLDEIAARRAAGHYCWVDFAGPDVEHSAAWLRSTGVESRVTDWMREDQPFGQFHAGRNAISFTLVDTRYADNELSLSPVHVVLGERFMATIHTIDNPPMRGMRDTYEDDFHAVARSGGFLLFELADHLIASYRASLAELARRVEATRARLVGAHGDEALAEVSELTRALLDYRRCVVSAREIVFELATRRSPFVDPGTQPFLEKQTLPLERLAADAATERTVLSESLSLYMGIVGHRTNKVVNRLTIVSMVFLPLGFLAALYGMNFEYMPELHWRYGYLSFWAVVVVLVGGIVGYMRYKRWI